MEESPVVSGAADSMISFLFVDSERVWRGGQDQLLTLLPGLLSRGHRIHLTCPPGALLEERARAIGARVYPVSLRRLGGIGDFLHLLRIMRQVRPDVIAFNTPKPILPGIVAAALTSVPVRIIFRRVSFPLRRNPVTRLKYSWGIDGIIAISESIRDQLRKGGVPDSRIFTIYEGMDLTAYEPLARPRPLPADGPMVFGTLAHLSPEKGISYLIDAAALIPEVTSRIRFLIVGDGQCRRDLEERVRSRNLDGCFSFVGFQNKPIDFLGRMDAFVLPSLSEGLSSAILSAMAAGLPVVATQVGGIPELIHSADHGILVPPGNPRALADGLVWMAEHPEEAFRMGQNNRRRMEERFTLARKITETEELCQALLRRKTGLLRSSGV